MATAPDSRGNRQNIQESKPASAKSESTPDIKKEHGELKTFTDEEKTSPVYKITEANQYALIINNLHNKIGEIDAITMKSSLEECDFGVQPFKEKLTAEEVKREFRKASKEVGDRGCFIGVILAKGGEGYVEDFDPDSSSAQKVTIEELYEPFNGKNCPNLLLHPKIFIIMTWENEPWTKRDRKPAQHDGEIPNVRTHPQPQIFKVPTEADILVYQCHMPGKTDNYTQFDDGEGYDKEGENGSWFIQSLSEAMCREQTEREFQVMLALVNEKMSEKYKKFKKTFPSKTLKHSDCIPCVTSMLTKQFLLKNKKV